jgi:hypothetical protein
MGEYVWKPSAAAKQAEETWKRSEFARGVRDSGSPSLLTTVVLARVVSAAVARRRR